MRGQEDRLHVQYLHDTRCSDDAETPACPLSPLYTRLQREAAEVLGLVVGKLGARADGVDKRHHAGGRGEGEAGRARGERPAQHDCPLPIDDGGREHCQRRREQRAGALVGQFSLGDRDGVAIAEAPAARLADVRSKLPLVSAARPLKGV